MDVTRLKLTPHKLFHHLGEVVKWQHGEDFAPIYVEVNPVDACNHRCIFCYADYLGHKKELCIERDLFIRIFRDMGEAGVKSVMVQGTGEPLLNKALPDAIVEGKKAGLDISLVTNGVLFTEESLEKIIPAISWMRVSALEYTPELYAKTHQCPESHYHRVIKNLKKAVEIRNRELSKNPDLETIIQAHHMPFPFNIYHTVDTVKLMKDIGLDAVYVKPAQIRPDNLHHEWPRDIHVTYQKILEECNQYDDDEFRVSVRWGEFDLTEVAGPFKKGYDACYGLYFSTNIDADAKIYPCYQLWRVERYCIGDLSKQSFKEIWFSEHRRQVLKDHEENFDLDQCHVQCRQHAYNKDLWELSHPPLHKNFL